MLALNSMERNVNVGQILFLILLEVPAAIEFYAPGLKKIIYPRNDSSLKSGSLSPAKRAHKNSKYLLNATFREYSIDVNNAYCLAPLRRDKATGSPLPLFSMLG
tara:strand:- start:6673 stop:6984 length:312 start_codon:yes stop_codon:yes gene_type:complete